MGQNTSSNKCSHPSTSTHHSKKDQHCSNSSSSSTQRRKAKEEQRRKLKIELKTKLDGLSNEMDKVMSVPMLNTQHIAYLNENYDNVLAFLQEQYKQYLQNNTETSEKIITIHRQLFDENYKDSLIQLVKNQKIDVLKLNLLGRQKLTVFYHLGVFDRFCESNNQYSLCETQDENILRDDIFRNSNDSNASQKSNSKGSNHQKSPTNDNTNQSFEKSSKNTSRRNSLNRPKEGLKNQSPMKKRNSLGYNSPHLSKINIPGSERVDQNVCSSDPSAGLSSQMQQISSNQNNSKKKELRRFISQLIRKESSHFIVLPMLRQFERVMISTFLPFDKLSRFDKSTKNCSSANDNSNLKTEYEETYSYLCSTIKLEEANFIKFAFQVVSITLLFLIDTLLLKSRDIIQSIPSKTFGSDTQLYSDIFCGQIAERQLLSLKSRLILMAAIEVDFRHTNIHKNLNLKLDDEELEKFVREQIQKNNEPDDEELKILAAIKAVSMYAASRESFIVKASKEEMNNLKGRQWLESCKKQSQTVRSMIKETADEEDVEEFEQINQKNMDDSKNEGDQKGDESGRDNKKVLENIKNIKETVQEINHFTLACSPCQSNNHFKQDIRNIASELTTKDTTSRQFSPSDERNFNELSIDEVIENNSSIQQKQTETSEYDSSPNQLRAQRDMQRDQEGCDRNIIALKLAGTSPTDSSSFLIPSSQQDQPKKESKNFKEFLGESLSLYLIEMHRRLDICLDEPLVFKKIKRSYKIIVKMKEIFTRYCTNFQESAQFIEQKENMYPLLEMLLKTYLAIYSYRRFDLYKLSMLLCLIADESRMQTYLGELQLFLFEILQVGDEFDTNLQSQVLTPIMRSEAVRITETLVEDEEFEAQFKILGFKSTNSMNEADFTNDIFNKSEMLMQHLTINQVQNRSTTNNNNNTSALASIAKTTI